jgi:hypothetical protein
LKNEFGFLSWIMRWLAGLFVVLGTYNPYGFSYYDWVSDDIGMTPLKMLIGVGLLILHVVAILASVRSLGPIGIGLLTALFASAAWVLIDRGLLDIEDPSVFQFISLAILATIYGTGLSWSHLRNRIAGQVDSTDVAQNSPI